MYHKSSEQLTSVENVLSIDVEDWFHILDVSSAPSLQAWIELESRVVSNTLFVLDLLSKYKTKGTFFVLGWVAKHFPDLVREIERRGHEIGTHGYGHELVYTLTPEQFRRDVGCSLEHLSRCTSRQILGYRAPGFSITPASSWALDVLVELGLRYDSSIFPMKRNHGGFLEFSQEAGWITTPKGNRILEVPVTPINLIGNKKIYMFGGGYFRLAPLSMITAGIKQLNIQNKYAMVYLHPREFDANHPKLKMNLPRYFCSYVNLNQTTTKFIKILEQFNFNSIEKVWDLASLNTLKTQPIWNKDSSIQPDKERILTYIAT
ncbi:MAG: polysaccharide deacetylase family protein [Coleofasciculus sp. S288]|nr:polysaccharide deacetylase family protein [Coleofasciculus sp. S288]